MTTTATTRRPESGKNPFLHFNEMLIAELRPRIGKEAACTLLYIHDLCKKGFYNGLHGVPSKAAQCFSQIDRIVASLKKPDSELVTVMSYPLMAIFFTTKGQLDLAGSLMARTLDAYKALRLEKCNLTCYLYQGNVQILYTRMLIRKGDSLIAIESLFTACRRQVEVLTDVSRDQREREFAAAAALDILVELSKFALRNQTLDGLYQQFLETISDNTLLQQQGEPPGDPGLFLIKYLRIIRLATDSNWEQLPDELQEFLQAEKSDDYAVLVGYLKRHLFDRLGHTYTSVQ
jgi:hypothetical protein